ncbi:transposase family protein [Nocardiopsis sp. HNM0947]|uniref:Transposase family protein n=1 Tax=Nocardiopsis coralli TaxID=2772213 RepID=A0ABR9P066_9ACTN|nr:transposase family protein [Nocardiopsis coralli]MBE2997236.1 transposase family protein [Nocardiopsis coralli]
MLVHLSKSEALHQLAAGFCVGTTTVWRYVRDITELLAEQVPPSNSNDA